jgi:hypothetical protein
MLRAVLTPAVLRLLQLLLLLLLLMLLLLLLQSMKCNGEQQLRFHVKASCRCQSCLTAAGLTPVTLQQQAERRCL